MVCLRYIGQMQGIDTLQLSVVVQSKEVSRKSSWLQWNQAAPKLASLPAKQPWSHLEMPCLACASLHTVLEEGEHLGATVFALNVAQPQLHSSNQVEEHVHTHQGNGVWLYPQKLQQATPVSGSMLLVSSLNTQSHPPKEAEAEHKLAQVTTEKDAESKELQSRTKFCRQTVLWTPWRASLSSLADWTAS
ncbi:hypothetical protein WJX77_002628 [Trebouxia sp. C0004]